MKTKSEESKKIALAFLAYLKKTKKGDLLALIVDELTVKVKKQSSVVIITTPSIFGASDRKKAIKFATKLVKGKKIDTEFEIDPSLLDGMKIRYKDKVWDMSLQSKIAKFETKSDE